MLLSLLWNKYVIEIILVITAICGVYVYIESYKLKIASLSAENATLTANLTSAKLSIANLESGIKTQNDAVAKLQQDSETRLANNAIEVQKAQTTASVYKQQAATLLKQTVKPGVSKCDAADQLINGELNAAK